ncbi:hypothetical protein O181_040330 [Austropuccinia psidii MF-1]|uniref:Uncharacterized protein n=1 Tax=Austropuccinia psidii MF-1 TaxID=1389203 RepID=A0A9Q3DGI9_9BASI|nr:hypothetical protein [Austropuccinia psidii MF-1]
MGLFEFGIACHSSGLTGSFGWWLVCRMECGAELHPSVALRPIAIDDPVAHARTRTRPDGDDKERHLDQDDSSSPPSDSVFSPT